MKSQFHHANLRRSWRSISPRRRHIYFYLLLTLITIVLASFRDRPAAGSVSDNSTDAPRITATEVYSPPAGR